MTHAPPTLDLRKHAVMTEPVSAGGLALLPLVPRLPPTSFLDGPGAAQDGALEVSEQPSAAVPSLLAWNKGSAPVLLAEGCLFLGGLQDRVGLQPVWVLPGTKVSVPVHCVEQSRWHARSPGRPGRFTLDRAHAGFRADRLSAPEDQGATWAAVARRRRAAGRPDPGGSVHELRPVHDLEALCHELVLPWAACGVVACWEHPGAVRWPLVEWFADPVAFRQAWPSVRRGLAEAHLEQLRRRGLRPRGVRAPRIRLSDMRRRLDGLGRAQVVREVAAGPRARGRQLRRRSSHSLVAGWLTEVEGAPVHLGVVRSSPAQAA